MKARRPAIGGPIVWAYTGIPWLVFTVIESCVTFRFAATPKSVGFLIVCCLVACVVLHVNRARNIHFQPMTVAIGLATVFASFIGFYNYDAHEVLSSYYDNSRAYTNVVPSEQALAFSDAGAIDFTSEAMVDITRGVGYRHKGTMYCIAPITDNTNPAKVEFWATGIDCCRNRPRDFYCDEAKNMKAHSGAVVFDNRVVRGFKSRYVWAGQGSRCSGVQLGLSRLSYIRTMDYGRQQVLPAWQLPLARHGCLGHSDVLVCDDIVRDGYCACQNFSACTTIITLTTHSRRRPACIWIRAGCRSTFRLGNLWLRCRAFFCGGKWTMSCRVYLKIIWLGFCWEDNAFFFTQTDCDMPDVVLLGIMHFDCFFLVVFGRETWKRKCLHFASTGKRKVIPPETSYFYMVLHFLSVNEV